MRIRFIAAGLAAALGLGFLAPSALAAPGDTEVTFTLTTGALSIAVTDGTVNLGEKALGSGSTISGNLDATTVTDNRNSTAGWNVYAYSTDFARTGGEADPIPKANVNLEISATELITANLRGGALDATQVGNVFLPTDGGASGNATHGTNPIVDGGKIGELVSAGLVDVLGDLTGGLLGGSSNHTLTFTPTLTVTIPAGQIAGVYTGTVYQTVA